MRAIVIERPGDEDAMKVGEVAPPALGPDDVRIRVAAAA